MRRVSRARSRTPALPRLQVPEVPRHPVARPRARLRRRGGPQLIATRSRTVAWTTLSQHHPPRIQRARTRLPNRRCVILPLVHTCANRTQGSGDDGFRLERLTRDDLLEWAEDHDVNVGPQGKRALKKGKPRTTTSSGSHSLCFTDIIKAIMQAPQTDQPTQEDLADLINNVSLYLFF
jgi:hypothetical protein